MNAQIAALLKPGESAILTLSRVSDSHLRVVVNFHTQPPMSALCLDFDTMDELDNPIDLTPMSVARQNAETAIAEAAKATADAAAQELKANPPTPPLRRGTVLPKTPKAKPTPPPEPELGVKSDEHPSPAEAQADAQSEASERAAERALQTSVAKAEANPANPSGGSLF